MKEFLFVKTLSDPELRITMSQRSEPMEAIMPHIDGTTVLAVWQVSVSVAGWEIVHKRVTAPLMLSRDEALDIAEAVMRMELASKFFHPVKSFEMQEGDY